MAYTFQEYPKALYRKGAYTAVADAAEEAQMRAAGWADWLTDAARVPQINGDTSREPEDVIPEVAALPVVNEPPKRKPGRPPKAK